MSPHTLAPSTFWPVRGPDSESVASITWDCCNKRHTSHHLRPASHAEPKRSTSTTSTAGAATQSQNETPGPKQELKQTQKDMQHIQDSAPNTTFDSTLPSTTLSLSTTVYTWILTHRHQEPTIHEFADFQCGRCGWRCWGSDLPALNAHVVVEAGRVRWLSAEGAELGGAAEEREEEKAHKERKEMESKETERKEMERKEMEKERAEKAEKERMIK